MLENLQRILTVYLNNLGWKLEDLKKRKMAPGALMARRRFIHIMLENGVSAEQLAILFERSPHTIMHEHEFATPTVEEARHPFRLHLGREQV